MGKYGELIKGCDELTDDCNFADYFSLNEYNTNMINRAVNGNCLYFTMMYLQYRLEWKTAIPTFNEESYRNLA